MSHIVTSVTMIPHRLTISPRRYPCFEKFSDTPDTMMKVQQMNRSHITTGVLTGKSVHTPNTTKIL